MHRSARTLISFVQLAALPLVVGCNSILGIQKAELSEGTGGECDLKLDTALVDGCIYRASCDPISPPFNVSNCVTYRSQTVFPEEEATINAKSCKQIEEALGRRYEPRSSCAGAPAGWVCSPDGSSSLYCGEGRPFVRDCKARGSVCTVTESAEPGAYPCGIPDHITCKANENKNTFCEGSLQLGCTEGRPVGYDCDEVGTSCFETATSATCLPDVGRCSKVNEITCTSSSKVDYCADPGVLVRYECAKGTSCQDGEFGIDCYVDDCEPEPGCQEGCAKDGVTLEFCVAGAKVQRNCTDYGFDYCSSYTSTDGVTSFAFCTMDENKPFPGTTADWSEEEAPDGTEPSDEEPDAEDVYCVPLPSGSCASLEGCSDETTCYYLVNGSQRIEDDCSEPGPGTDQVAALCDL